MSYLAWDNGYVIELYKIIEDEVEEGRGFSNAEKNPIDAVKILTYIPNSIWLGFGSFWKEQSFSPMLIFHDNYSCNTFYIKETELNLLIICERNMQGLCHLSSDGLVV